MSARLLVLACALSPAHASWGHTPLRTAVCLRGGDAPEEGQKWTEEVRERVASSAQCVARQGRRAAAKAKEFLPWTDSYATRREMRKEELATKPAGDYPNTFFKYGVFCGQGPPLNNDCSIPRKFVPVDDVDTFCSAHDTSYCLCGHAALKAAEGTPRPQEDADGNPGEPESGCKKLPNTVMLALRSRLGVRLVMRNIQGHYVDYFDEEVDQLKASTSMLRCIHRADAAFAQSCAELRDAERLPRWWGRVTRWKYNTMIHVFEKNCERDEKVLEELDALLERAEARKQHAKEEAEEQAREAAEREALAKQEAAAKAVAKGD